MRLICFDFSAIQNVLPFVGKGVDTVWAFYATKDRIKFSEYKGHWPDFAIEKAVVPSNDLTFKFRSTVDPLVANARNNELQIQTLSVLRDTLLPRLISGQLQLSDVKPNVEEALG
jgi:type I restriction enzyme S subunit